MRAIVAATLLLAGCAGVLPDRAPTLEERSRIEAALDEALGAGSITGWLETATGPVRVTWARGPILAADAGAWRLLVVGGTPWRLDEGGTAWRKLPAGSAPAGWDPFETVAGWRERIDGFRLAGETWLAPGEPRAVLELNGGRIAGWTAGPLKAALKFHPGRAPMRFDDVPIPFDPEMSAAVRKAAESTERR